MIISEHACSVILFKVDVFREMVGAPSQFNTVLFGGFLGSIFSFLQFLASPVIGGLSDRFGRKPLLILTTIGKIWPSLTCKLIIFN